MPFQPGQLVGDYEVLDVLGKGGMGRVYRVRNVISDRVEAMKVLLEDIAIDSELEDRFLVEIRTLARLDHPNIAKLHTAFKAQQQLLMVMEFVEGVDLRDCAKERPLPLNKVVAYIRDLLAALGYAHRHGVVHRDIKPSNIMVTSQGSVKLMDFGIAKSNSEPLLTRPGTTMGSMLYMSPEQVRGEAVDARSDLYSLGVVLYELTAGRCPFEAESTYRILDAQLNSPPPPPIQINPSLPQSLNEIILTALEKDPAKRFQNADAFRKVLESVAATGDAEKTTTIPPAGTHVSRSPAQPTASAANASVSAGMSPPPSPAAVPPPNPRISAAMPPIAQTGASRGHRSLWMAAGAVACLGVLAAALVLVPHFRKSSAASVTSPAPISTPASNKPNGVPQESSPPQVVPPTAATPVTSQTTPNEVPPLRERPNGSSTTARGNNRQVAQAPPATRSQTAETAPPPAVTAPPPQPLATTPAPPAGPSDEDLNKANEALINIHARMDTVGQSLTNLKQQQAAMGVGLRGDIVASESRMLSYFQMAERAIQNRDLDAARKNTDRTEEELSKLEHFLGR